MLDSCRITKPGVGPRVLDPVTGQYVDPAPVVVYEGRCRLGSAGQLAGISDAVAGEAVWDTQSSVLHLPVGGSEAVAPGHTVTYLTAVFDLSLVGNVYGVTGPHEVSQGTARRLLVKRAVH